MIKQSSGNPWKVQNFGTIALVENVVISDNQNIADIFI